MGRLSGRRLAPVMYGIVGGMEKTTVYLTTDQKAALARAADAEGRSEARLIREGVDAITARHRAGETIAPVAGWSAKPWTMWSRSSTAFFTCADWAFISSAEVLASFRPKAMLS